MSCDFDLCLTIDLDIVVNVKFGRYIFQVLLVSSYTITIIINDWTYESLLLLINIDE